MKTVKRHDATPMYVQIADQIRRAIERGELVVGECLGGQLELAERYGVSRITVRQAIDLLAKEGLVTTRQGKGTYVSSATTTQELGELIGLSEVLDVHRAKHKTEVREMRWTFPDAAIANFFSITQQEPVLLIRRLHLHNDRPMALAEIYLPPKIGSSITQEDLGGRSLYTLMEERLGVHVGQGTQRIRAISANEEIAKVLQVPRGSPLLWAQRETYSASHQPVEQITFYYLAEAYEFVVHLQRAGETLIPSPSPR